MKKKDGFIIGNMSSETMEKVLKLVEKSKKISVNEIGQIEDFIKDLKEAEDLNWELCIPRTLTEEEERESRKHLRVSGPIQEYTEAEMKEMKKKKRK